VSDVGLDADLSLDIRNALSQVARLERALDAAAHVTVTADARELTGEVTSAVDAADTAVTVTGEAAELTGDVTAAIDAADTAVSVTGDASELTGDVTAAIDDADTNVVVTGDATELTGDVTAAVDAADTHVNISADAGSLRDAADASNALGLSLGTARLNATSLGTVLRGGIFVGAAKSLYEIVQAASDLEESVNKTNVVFDEGADEIRTWGTTAATSVGLSEQAALEAAGTFGNLFTALGQSRQEATALAPEVVQLSADLASFNNLRVDETLEKMRSGLVGEIEPLRSLGISFNAAQVEAKAMELGLADANGEISEGAKVSARWALIQEQSSNAAGDFARTSDGLANSQRILTAEFQNMVTELGVALLPAMKELVDTGRDNLPVLRDLGLALGELLAAGLGAVIPLLGTTTSLLRVATPLIETFANVLEDVPEPIIQIVAALVALNRIGRLTGLVQGAGGLTAFRNAGGGVAGILAAVNPALAVGAGLLIAYSTQAQQAADRAARTKAQFDALTKAFDDQQGSAHGLTVVLDDMARKGEKLADVNGVIERIDVGDVFERAGISAAQFTSHLDDNAVAFARWAEGLDRAAGEGGELVDDLEDLRAHMQSVADATIVSGIEAGRWTEKQAMAAREATATGDAILGTPVEALEVLTVAEQGAGAAAEEATTSFAAQRAGLESLAEAAPGVGATLAALATQGGSATTEFVNLAAAIGQANLSQEQMQIVADQLGVPLDTLALHVDEVTASIGGFVSGVEGSLPNVVTQLSSLGEGVTLQGIRDEFQKTFEAMVSFEANLALLAAFPNVQAAAAAAGPQVAAALAQGVKDGKTSVLAEMELMATGTAQAEQRIIDEATNVWGPGFAAAQAAAGIGGTGAFARTFQLGGHTSAQGTQARNIMQAKGRELDQAARGAGSNAASGFRDGIAPMPGHAGAANEAAKGRIGSGAYDAGYGAGSSMGSGFIAGLDIYVGAAADKAAQLVLQAKAAADRAARSGSPSRLFMEVGADIGQGLAIGIEDETPRVEAAMTGQVDALVGALARVEPAVAGIEVAQVDPRLLAAATAGGVAGGNVTSITVAAGAVVIQVPAGADERTARRLGAAAGAGFLGTIRDRQIAATARFQ